MTHTRLTLWCEHLQLPSPSVSCVNGPIVSLSLVIGSLPGISGNPMNDWKRIIDIACRLPRRIINTAMPAETIQLQELRLKTCGSGATWRFAGWPWDRKARFFFFFSFSYKSFTFFVCLLDELHVHSFKRLKTASIRSPDAWFGAAGQLIALKSFSVSGRSDAPISLSKPFHFLLSHTF